MLENDRFLQHGNCLDFDTFINASFSLTRYVRIQSNINF